jgi:hypothetical protein
MHSNANWGQARGIQYGIGVLLSAVSLGLQYVGPQKVQAYIRTTHKAEISLQELSCASKQADSDYCPLVRFTLHPEDGTSTFLRNVTKYLPDHME